MGLISFIVSLTPTSVTPPPPPVLILMGDDEILWGDTVVTFED